MKTLPYELHGGKLSIHGQAIKFPLPVEEILEINSLIIVRLALVGKQGNRNIYALDKNGQLIWQIEASNYGAAPFNPFANIRISDSNELIATDFLGIDFKVNLNDGTLGEIIAFNRF